MKPKCFYCGADVIWGSEEMLSDLSGCEIPEEEDTIVGFFTCSKCGATYEVYKNKEII